MVAKVNEKFISNFKDYSVTTDGRVFTHKFDKTKELSSAAGKSGYAAVTLSNDKLKQSFQVHRLVAMAFLPKPPKGSDIVNHIDGNKLNNNLKNLEWTTRKGNAKHYEKTIAPKLRIDKKMTAQSDILTRLKLVNYAHSACTSIPELYQSVIAAAVKDCKEIA